MKSVELLRRQNAYDGVLCISVHVARMDDRPEMQVVTGLRKPESYRWFRCSIGVNGWIGIDVGHWETMVTDNGMTEAVAGNNIEKIEQ